MRNLTAAVACLALFGTAFVARAQQGQPPPAGALPVDQGATPGGTAPGDENVGGDTADPGVAEEPPAPPVIVQPESAPSADAEDDAEVPPVPAPEPEEAPVGQGSRLFLQVQANTQVGALIEDTSSSGFAFDRATLTGVPDALIGIRLERLTLALGLTWTQISQPMMFTNPCSGGSTERRDLENSATLFGILPTARYDVLTTTDGRGRMEAGLTPVLLFSSQSRESFMSCSGGSPTIQTTSSTDTVLGFDALLAGRYHIWPALTVGVEVGFAYLVFDFDEDPMSGDPPSVRAFTFYSALTLAIELPI